MTHSVRRLKVGLIGCGAIGTALARMLQQTFLSRMSLEYLCDKRTEKAEILRNKIGISASIVSLDDLIRRSDLIVEAASAHISGEVAKKALEKGKTVLMMSVGGLLKEKSLFQKRTGQGNLLIPSGAIAGIDGLLAGKEGKLKSVRLVTRKAALALKDAPYFLKRKFPKLGKKPVCLFRGKASEAVIGFPQNINVAAVLSLAGFGPKKTEVEIWTAQDFKRNEHEITLEGDFGRIRILCENVPSPDNPKTSQLAVLSAAACLRKYLSSVKIGT